MNDWGNSWGVPQVWPVQKSKETIQIKELGPSLITLTIQTDEGPQEVQATQIGDLAIYRDWAPPYYRKVIHVPTLCNFNALYPGPVEGRLDKGDTLKGITRRQCDQLEAPKNYTREALIMWATKVQSEHREDWEALAQLTPQTFKGIMHEPKQKIFKWCRSVEI